MQESSRWTFEGQPSSQREQLSRGPEAGAGLAFFFFFNIFIGGLAYLRNSESGWNQLRVGTEDRSEVREYESRGVACADSHLKRIPGLLG